MEGWGLESGGVGGQSKKVKLQTRAITEVMYTAYSIVTTKGSLVIFFWQNTCKLGKKNTVKSNIFHHVSAASTGSPCPRIITLLLWFYKNVQIEWQLYSPFSEPG